MGMVGLRDVFVVAPTASFTHQHHQHGHESINLGGSDQVHGPNATALGVGVIPLLTAAPCLGPQSQSMDDHLDLLNNGRNCGKINQGIQFWQNQSSGFNSNSNNNNDTNTNNNCVVKKVTLFDQTTSSPHNLLQSGSNVAFIGSGGGNSGSSSGTTTCQDCGNQAKKDCSHRRCRTCCRSRGFDCATHVKSTWVPATRRRERQLMVATAPGGGGGSSGATSGVKKPRLVTSQTTTTSHTSTSNTTPRSFDTSSSHQDASFKESLPGQVRAQAVFKCVKVTSVDDGEDEFAYQASVKIGGHIFKGFLYDQGIDRSSSSSSRDAIPNISELHLGGATSGSGARTAAAASSSSPLLDQSDVYAASGGVTNALLGGRSSYGNNPLN